MARPAATTLNHMLPATAYVIRQATIDDERVLERLAALDGQKPLSGRVLIGEIDGIAAAAVGLDDGRIVADPFQRTAQLITVLTMRRRSLLAVARRPARPARGRSGFRPFAPA